MRLRRAAAIRPGPDGRPADRTTWNWICSLIYKRPADKSTMRCPDGEVRGAAERKTVRRTVSRADWLSTVGEDERHCWQRGDGAQAQLQRTGNDSHNLRHRGPAVYRSPTLATHCQWPDLWECSQCSAEQGPTNLGARTIWKATFLVLLDIFCIFVHRSAQGMTSPNGRRWKRMEEKVSANTDRRKIPKTYVTIPMVIITQVDGSWGVRF